MSNDKASIILDVGYLMSELFELPPHSGMNLKADGLQGDDYVIVELLQVTSAGPQGGVRCPGPVSLPDVANAVPLRCRNGARHILTANHPFMRLDSPQIGQLRLRFHPEAGDQDVELTQVKVWQERASGLPGCADCQCVEPYRATYLIANTPAGQTGFAYVTGDDRDPDATTEFTQDGETIYLYPTPRRNATVRVPLPAGIFAYAVNAGATS